MATAKQARDLRQSRLAANVKPIAKRELQEDDYIEKLRKGGINYLPFVYREVLNYRSITRPTTSLSLASAAISGGFKGATVEYQDLCIKPLGGYYAFGIRYGFEGRGYLFEEPIELFNTITKIKSGGANSVRNGWRFPKPYKLDPGQSLRVDYTVDETARSTGVFGACFHCKRMDTLEQVFLYGSDLRATVASHSGSLQRNFLRNPGDVPLLVYGVSASSSTAIDTLSNGMIVQIYDASGREIFVPKLSPNALAIATSALNEQWINFETGYAIELGRYNGWELPVENPFILELECNDLNILSDDATNVIVTLRGCIEVHV